MIISDLIQKIRDWFNARYGPVTGPVISNDSQYDKIILPLIRNVMPNIIAADICGVQPMNSPHSEIFSLRAKYLDDQQQLDAIAQRKATLDQILENTRQELEKKNDDK